jgi:hypothetical protein
VVIPKGTDTLRITLSTLGTAILASEIGTFKIISHDYKDGIFRMRFKLI